MSATGGRAGGERTQFSLRLCMMPFRARVLPGPEVLVGRPRPVRRRRAAHQRAQPRRAGGADGRPAQGGGALGQARLGAKLRRDAVDAVPRRDRPSASATKGAMPKPILKPPLAMNSPGRSGWCPSIGARDRARGRMPAQRSITGASRSAGQAARARAMTASSCVIGGGGVVPFPFRGGADRHRAVGMGHDVQALRIELRQSAQVAGQDGGLPLHARADDPVAREPVQLQEARNARGMNDRIASRRVAGDLAPRRVSAATRAATARLGCSRAVSVSKTTRPVGCGRGRRSRRPSEPPT
jgi:hypothetical protein